MIALSSAPEELNRTGFSIIDPLLDSDAIELMRRASERVLAAAGCEGRRGGIRDPFRHAPELRDMCQNGAPRDLAGAIVGPQALVTRAILFDKTERSNWAVPWHQDVTIAVRERRDTPGLGPWSTKGGITHVQPPAAVLDRMLTIRISLDECGEENGPLLVLPGSHRDDLLSENAVEHWKARIQPVACTTGIGGAVLMRPLLLHASAEAARPTRRRILHLEYAAGELPNGLEFMRA